MSFWGIIVLSATIASAAPCPQAAGDTNAAYAEFFVKTMRRVDGGGWQTERGPLVIGEVDGRIYELALNPQTNQWVIQQR